jgi:hypothetical protein
MESGPLIEAPIRPRRSNAGKLPARLRDMVPSELIPMELNNIIDKVQASSTPEQAPLDMQPLSPIQETPEPPVISLPNSFGLFREYKQVSFPLHDPESERTIEDFFDAEQLQYRPPPTSSRASSSEQILSTVSRYWPYPNESSFRLGEWFWESNGNKSKHNFSSLLNILCDNSFSPADIRNVSWDAVDKSLGAPSSLNSDKEHRHWLSDFRTQIGARLKSKSKSLSIGSRALKPPRNILSAHSSIAALLMY